MGYSKSRTTLLKMLPKLEPLERGEPCTWRVDSMSADKFAYKVREALYIARLYANEFPELAEAAQRYRVSVKGPGLVAAEPHLPMGPVLSVEGGEELSATPKEVLGPQSDLSIMEEWLDRKLESLHFPEANLDNEELERLYHWAERRELIFFVSDKALTLQRHDPELAEYAWKPGKD